MNAKMFWMMQIARRPLCGVGNAISGAISPKNSFQSSKKEVNQSINSVMHLHSLTVKKKFGDFHVNLWISLWGKSSLQ